MKELLRRAGKALRNPWLVRQRLLEWVSGPRGRRHIDVGSAHLWEHKRQFQIGFLRSQGLLPGHHLFDIGCGTLRGGIALIDYLEPGHYTGLEVRADVLESGREELRDSGLETKRPQLVHAPDIGAISLDTRADYVWAFSTLIHMSDEVLERCLAFVAAHLAPEGLFLANVNLGEDGQAGQWWGFPVMRHSSDFYEKAAARHGLACEDLGSLRDFGERDDGKLAREAPEARRMLRFRLA